MDNSLQARIDELTAAVKRLNDEIEQRKQTEVLLRESEGRYRAIFNGTSIGLAQIGLNGCFLEVNDSFCNIAGYSREKLLHLSYLDITHPDDRETAKRIQERVLGGEIPSASWEKRYVREDGTVIWLNVNLSLTAPAANGNCYLLAAMENISDRRSLQESLGHVATNMARAEMMPLSGIWKWNVRSKETTASPEVFQLFGLSPTRAAVPIETFLDRIHPDDRAGVEQALEFAVKGLKSYQIEYRIKLPDGTQRVVSASGDIYRRNVREGSRVMVGILHDITVRRRAEQALRESEQRFRQLIENAVDGIIIVNRESDCSDANRSACEMLGYSRDELIGKTVAGLIPERYLQEFENARENYLQNVDAIRPAEWELIRKDGNLLPVEVSAGMLPDGRWTAIVRDISERKHTQMALERFAAEVQDLYDNAPCGYLSLNQDGVLLRINKTELAWLGYESSELVEKMRMEDLLTEDSRTKFGKVFDKFLHSGQLRDLELEMVCKSGSILPVLLNASAVFDEHGNFIVGRATLFDMTELAEVQKKLRQAAAVFEHTHDAIIITDANGKIIAVNRAFTKVTGYNPEDVIGKNPRLLKSERQDGEFYRKLWSSLEQTGTWQGEIWDRRKSGELFPAWESVTAVKDSSGKVTDYIAIFSDITTIKETEERLVELAYHDALTGLPNRLLFNDRMAWAIAHAKRHGTRAALLFMDLDRFKLINDTLGHVIGDKLLQAVAARLKDVIRAEDTVARLGGDEFAIIVTHPNDAAEPARLAQKLVKLVAQPIHLLDQALTISTSIGISIYPDHASDAESLMKCADSAMYAAKEKGRNSYAFYQQEMTRTATEILMIDRGLRSAIRLNELVLLYQPVIDLGTGRIVGAETLIRWNNPQLGLQPPARFIHVAEETDLIESVGDWALDTACAQLQHWALTGLSPFRLAVNLSVRQLKKPHFIEDMRKRIEAFPPLSIFTLDIEVTETALQTEPDIVDALRELKSLGLEIAIDDFGTGYSSLSSLKHLPADILKIDRSFIDGIPDDKDDQALTSAIIAMGHSLGMRVIAEGIETEQQLQFVMQHHCDEAQGFLFFAPMPVDEFEHHMSAYRMAPMFQALALPERRA